jgi:hypothetical protein
LLALCGLVNFVSSGWCATGKLLAGAAKISITPETDEPLHDPVYARSLVLDINGERLAFVALDLGVYTSPHVVADCKEKYRIAKVFLCSSHNHTAPRRPGKTPETANLKAFYDDQIIKVVGSAVSNMFPARLAGGRRSFRVSNGSSRDDGHVNPDGDDYRAINPNDSPGRLTTKWA